MDARKQAGENAAGRLVRLLATFDNEVIEEGSGDRALVTFSGEGIGELVIHRAGTGGKFDQLLSFSSFDELELYFMSTPLGRTIRSIQWAKNIDLPFGKQLKGK